MFRESKDFFYLFCFFFKSLILKNKAPNNRWLEHLSMFHWGFSITSFGYVLPYGCKARCNHIPIPHKRLWFNGSSEPFSSCNPITGRPQHPKEIELNHIYIYLANNLLFLTVDGRKRRFGHLK